jgi:lipopolysaccharide biosynthesis protein
MNFKGKSNIKRLAIYFFYDKDGIVDDYVPYMLNDLKKNITELLIVCNGKLAPEGREKLEKLTPNVFVRENKGFDVWAYKEAMEYYGWDKLKTLDELILMNCTIMGPLYPLKEMFDEMNRREVDFWGITVYHKIDIDPFGKCEFHYIPLHIQSHFIAIRKHILNSIEFKKYWESRPMITNYEEAVCWHEAIFTKKFEDMGFIWQTYVDTFDLQGYCYQPILMNPLELIKNRRCPIFKRRSFFHEYDEFLSLSNGNATVDLYEYIKNNLTYDVNLIWDNILRTQNQADIKKCMQINYLLPSKTLQNSALSLSNKRIALVIHIYFIDLIEYCYQYAQSMPKESDIYITTDTIEKKETILKVFKNLECHNLDVILIQNRGRDVSALLIGVKPFIMDYDYVCFVHDKKVPQLDLGVKGASFSYQCFENTLNSSVYVKNVIDTFENNPRLGLLTPPPPGFADYYPTIGLEWGNNFESTKKLYDKLDMTIPMDRTKAPVAPLGTMFWFRPKALKLLFDQDWEYKDFPLEPNENNGTLLHAVERIYSFVVQQEGYYPAWVMVDTFARLEITNLYYMLSEVNKRAFQIYGLNSHYGLINTMQYSIDINSSDKQNDQIFRKLLKNKLKKKIPKRLWNFLRKIYHAVGGKKWVG